MHPDPLDTHALERPQREESPLASWLMFAGWLVLLVAPTALVAWGALRDDARLAVAGSVVAIAWALANAVFVHRHVRPDAEWHRGAGSVLWWVVMSGLAIVWLQLPLFHDRPILHSTSDPYNRLDFGMDRPSPLLPLARTLAWVAVAVHVVGMAFAWVVAQVARRRELRG